MRFAILKNHGFPYIFCCTGQPLSPTINVWETIIFKTPNIMMHVHNFFQILKDYCKPPNLFMLQCCGC